jgi:outer membrane protein OmpA-like peptidoglycan-associated protein
MTRIHRLIGLSCLAAAIAGSAAPASADCTDLINRLNAAVAARRLPEAKAIEKEIGNDAVCGNRMVEAQRLRTGLQLTLASDLMKNGTMGPDVEALLLDADQPGVRWQAAKAVGDLRLSQKKYAEATAAFERAIEIIKNPGKTPQAPAKEAIVQLFQSASEAKLVAADEENKLRKPTYVTAAKGQRGEVGGILSASIRGTVLPVPLPIQFESASAVLTQLGQEAAKDLADALREQSPPEVIIVGHTDERGGDAYNMTLSENRAKAVKRYLEQNGIRAPIKTIGKGKSEPLTVDLPDLSREEIWALHRRVEWRRE